MKQIITIFFFIFSFLLTPCFAQENFSVVEQFLHALKSEDTAVIETIWTQITEKELDELESLFWIKLSEKDSITTSLAWKLGNHYKEQRNYDKAHLFLKELLSIVPENIDVLSVNAEIAIFRANEKQALELYEKILSKDPGNLPANIFVGNYHYLQAHKEKQKLDEDYGKLKSPTKMQYAGYRDNLEVLVNSGYAKARLHLERAVSQFSSLEVKRTLEKIESVEKEARK